MASAEAAPMTELSPPAPMVPRLAPTIGLFCLAPLVGEYLLGVMSITQLPLLVVLAPLYGGGALLVRETVRRLRLGWPSMVVLALAYAVVEEGLVLQTLFNPDYMGLGLLDYGYVPALGMGAWWTVYVLGIHSIWSIAVPIALMESLTRDGRHAPWLNRRWLAAVVALFLTGCALAFLFADHDVFMASTAQLSMSLLAVVALVGSAIVIGRRRSESRPSAAAAPHVLVAGGASLGLGSAFMTLLLAGVLLGGAIPGLTVSGMISDAMPPAANVAGLITAIVAGSALTWNWSRRSGWSERHCLAVAGGLLLTYAWYGIVQVLLADGLTPTVTIIGQGLLATAAIVLLSLAWRKTDPAGQPGQGPTRPSPALDERSGL